MNYAVLAKAKITEPFQKTYPPDCISFLNENSFKKFRKIKTI